MNQDIKVLIIDDDPDFITALKLLLSKDHCQIFKAADGNEGIRQVETIRPDIILLDIVLPDMNGKEVCRQIKNNPENAGILVILMSGLKTTSIDQAAGLESGADGYMAKTMSNREMRARLRIFIQFKRIENELISSEKRYKKLFSTMIIGYAIHEIISDDKGKPVDYKFLEVNPEFEKLTGLKGDEIKGRSALEVFPDTEPYWIETYGNVVLNDIEHRFINYAASLNKYFEVYAFPTGQGQFATLFYDVTDRVKSEERIQKINNELQKLNNDKDKLFGIIAHDLKNAFNIIIGFSELLLNGVKNQDKDEISEFAKSIHDTGNQTYKLLENLLEWAMLEQGKIAYSPQEFNLYHQVNEIFEFLYEQAENKQISLISEIRHNFKIFADEKMIQTIFRNLISNAIKFSYKGSKITVSANSTETGIEFAVSDQGMGIKKEDIEKILRSDITFSTAGTEKEKGTGLGLMLCKEFINKQNGQFLIESEFGKGSRFIVRLPNERSSNN